MEYTVGFKMTCDKVKPSAFVVQALSCCAISFLTSLTGFVYAWPSYTVTNFMTNETQLVEPMTQMQVSLLGSLTNIGALVTTPLCGYAVNKYGRKYTAMFFGLPYVISWTIISMSQNVTLILLAVGLAGIGAAGQAVSAVYISEIAQDSIRGGLASTTVTGYYIGLLISYTLGGYLTYSQVIYTHLLLSVLYMVLLVFLKESPVFLIQNGRKLEAAKSIAFYRRVSESSKEIEVEINRVRMQLNPQIDKIWQNTNEPDSSKELLDPTKVKSLDQPVSSWRFLLHSESSRSGLLSVLIVMTLSILMGAVVLQVYAEPLMREAVPSMPSNLAAILLAVDFLVASMICGFIVDKLGRKTLFTYSSLAAAICTLLLGVQLRVYFAPPWVTVLIIYMFIFVYTIGAATVPFILSAEVFLPEVRGFCNSVSSGCMWVMNFTTLIFFNPLVESIGLGFVFCGFSVICLIGAFYGHFCLPETKGLSVDEIQLRFLKRRKQVDLF